MGGCEKISKRAGFVASGLFRKKTTSKKGMVSIGCSIDTEAKQKKR